MSQRAKVPRDHAERVLGHAMPGVEGVYDQYSYQTEKGEALAKLADLVAKIVKGGDSVAIAPKRYRLRYSPCTITV
jgi:hypothetical protein